LKEEVKLLAIARLFVAFIYAHTAAAEVIVYSFPNIMPKLPEGAKLSPTK